MQFSSIAEFIAMDGHGFFVWLSYGFTLALFAIITFMTFSQKKHVIHQIKLRQKREHKLKQAAEQAAKEQEV